MTTAAAKIAKSTMRGAATRIAMIVATGQGDVATPLEREDGCARDHLRSSHAETAFHKGTVGVMTMTL